MIYAKQSKVVLALVLVLTLIITCCVVSAASEEQAGSSSTAADRLIFGDSNGDGVVNSVDYATLKYYVDGKINALPYDKAGYTMDVNADGVINSNDVDLVRNFLLGNISSFPADEIINGMPETVFEYKYENYAWGYQFAVLDIDNEGNIHVSGIFPENLPITKIPKIEVQEKYLDLLKASEQPLSNKVQKGADAGAYTYTGYIPGSEKLQQVLLALEGDYRQQNLSPYAASLVQWLKQIVNDEYEGWE
ncbi:MAG TPA: dockerin type I repeat-containing protein [Ruminiclostridium sp.]|nr:dockerin type I repeat-containing protein [Ruminiclostridium sp.]